MISKCFDIYCLWQGKLNIFSIYRFMLSVLFILKWLISLWYVVHVCRENLTSPLIHCILCFMWLGSCHLFSHKCMYVGGVNFTSLLFMTVYRIYIFIVWFVFASLLMIWQKGGERFWEFIYACLFSYLCIYVLFMQKGEKNLVGLCMFISLFMHIWLFCFMHFIEYIFMVIVMHELRGSFSEA